MLPLLALACACTGNQTGNRTGEDSLAVDSVRGIRLDSVKCHLHKNLIEGKEAPSYDIAYVLLEAQGNDDASRLFNEELARAFFGKEGIPVDSAMRMDADSLASSYTADLKEFYDPACEDDFAFQYTCEQQASVAEDSYPGVAAYSVDMFSYTGGAHGNSIVTCLNLNLTTGRAIRYADFFVKGKERETKGIVEKSFMVKNGCASMGQLVEKTSIGSLGDIYVRDGNFLLLRDSVEFVYNPYEVAPYACGTITTRVAYSDLAPCINKDVLPHE